MLIRRKKIHFKSLKDKKKMIIFKKNAIERKDKLTVERGK